MFFRDTKPYEIPDSLDELQGPADRVVDALASNGYTVAITRRTEQFARVHVHTDAGQQVDIDMGMDWREAEPVTVDDLDEYGVNAAELAAIKERLTSWAAQLQQPAAETPAQRRSRSSDVSDRDPALYQHAS